MGKRTNATLLKGAWMKVKSWLDIGDPMLGPALAVA
jgi:hypothetical protein